MALKFVELNKKSHEASVPPPAPPPVTRKAKKAKPPVAAPEMAAVTAQTPAGAVAEALPTIHVPSVDPQALTPIEALTQEFCGLYKQYVEHDMKDIVKRMDEIKKELQGVANEQMDAKKVAVFSCKDGTMTFSERGKSYEVHDPMALVTALNDKFGPEVAFSVVAIALTPLRKILSENELKKYLKEEPGARTLKLVTLT
jgi:hypothetical protein